MDSEGVSVTDLDPVRAVLPADDRSSPAALQARRTRVVVDTSVLDSFRVHIYGETAVVWFSRHMTGPKSGKIVAVTYRFVDVFVKRAGRWQCVSSQSTKVTGQ